MNGRILVLLIVIATLFGCDKEGESVGHQMMHDMNGAEWKICDGRGMEKFAGCLEMQISDGECLLVLVAGRYPPDPRLVDYPEGCLVVAPQALPEEENP